MTRVLLNGVAIEYEEHGMPYSRRIVELIAGCMPNCRLVDVPGVTHFMSYQAPTVFDRLVLDFLAEHR